MANFQNKTPLQIFLSYYKPHWKLFAIDMVCALFYAAVDVAFPVLSRYALDVILPNKNFRFFFIFIALLVLLYVFRSLASWLVTFLGHRFGVLVETDMRRDLFAHIEKQPFSFFDKNRTGHIMSRVTYDLFEVTELAHHGPEDIFTAVLTLVGSFFIMFSIRWELAVVVFAVVPIMILSAMQNRKSLALRSKKVKERTAEINASLESSISGARVTKVFTNEDYENKRFGKSNQEYFQAKSNYHKAMAFFHTRIEFFTHILYVVVLAIGGYLIMKNRLTIADIVAANLFIGAFLQPIRKLTNFAELYTTGMAGFNRFVEIMKEDNETLANPGSIAIEKAKGDIVYENVSFSYNDSVHVLSKVNLSLKAGQTLALIGPSGGGKTTLCHLLPRFYELTSGRILLDGKDIKDITLQSLRQQIGLVQQDVFLFAGTIRENIAYGKIDASFDEIVEAAKRAEIHEDILKMPQGYDTLVGERGIKLSGGQKQRVSIARIFLKNPPILILDEATSALDTVTEIKIQKSFDELSKGRTTFVIAHRLTTIKNADTIAVINDENISEIGTHEELLEKGGLYKELYEAQYALR